MSPAIVNYDVVLVSDYDVVLASSKQILQVLGELDADKIHTVRGGVNALATLDDILGMKDRIGVVVSDIKMKEVSGFDVLEFMKERYPSVPVILASGEDISYWDCEATNGAFAYVKKGDGRMLVEKVNAALSHKS